MISRIGKLLVETTGASRLDAAQALRGKDVALVVGADADEHLVRSALALVMRCFTGRVVVRADRGAVPDAVVHVLEDEARGYGAAERLAVDDRGETITLGLACTSGDCFVDAGGWSVSVNEMAPNRAPATAPASAFAASAGVAKLFAALIGRDTGVRDESWTAPMLDFGLGETPTGRGVELGRLIIIGAGAIGSGLAHVLRGSRWRANITLIDYQRYDEPNHETTLVISKDTSIRQRPKADALAALLRSETITVHPLQEQVLDGHRLLVEPVESLVCAVDNPELRRLLDHTAARVVLNAGVGGTREDAGMVLWTRHRRDDVQLSSHYRLEANGTVELERAPEDVATDECSRVSYANVSLAAPFMGLAAGALLAAGLAQEALGMVAPTNYVKFDMLGLQRWSTRQRLVRSRAT